MERDYNLVYRTTNNINGKIYIGVHRTNNINDGYIGSGDRLKKAIKKYGKENFTREILHNFTTYKKAREKEGEIVNDEFIARDDTYNLIPGGIIWNRPTLTIKEKPVFNNIEFRRKQLEFYYDMKRVIFDQIPRIFEIYETATGKTKALAENMIRKYIVHLAINNKLDINEQRWKAAGIQITQRA